MRTQRFLATRRGGTWISIDCARMCIVALLWCWNGGLLFAVHIAAAQDPAIADAPAKAVSAVARGYSLPLIDLASERDRQVVVDREAGQYLGHPTTLLLEDGRTMLCVYPKGHGKGAIVYKRSADGGLTWSERLPTPASWATSQEVPTLHRVVDPQGKRRIIMFSGLYPCRMASSEDDGLTWSELAPVGNWGGIVTMGCVIELKTAPGHYLALFHDDGRFFSAEGKKTATMTLYQTLSTDGGLTWGEPKAIFASDEVHLCEPGAVRSPDGRQLAVLLRENRRKHNSHVIFSDDEGNTWTEPRELPGSLTGDRHTGGYARDGRLFISFRDTTLESPTRGDWVAWVGTYEDIVAGREGQYRVRLMDNHKGQDCAYPGVELLGDGTFVATTYGHWTEGKQPYIVSVRLKLSEIDERAARLQQNDERARETRSTPHETRRAVAREERTKRRANVLFILSDDQRADTIRALGNPRIRTPHLDRLVESGFVFHRAYCMGSTVPAVCLPSRSMLMTSRTLYHLPDAKSAAAVESTPLLPRTLGAAGYDTLRTGKEGNHPAYADAAFARNFNVPRSATCSTTHADTAISFLREDRGDKPFFLYVALAAPHDPRVAPQNYMDLYGPEDVVLPANYLPVHPFDNGEMTVRDEQLAPWPRTPRTIAEHLADYYSVITYMDAEIGRILATLDEIGERENTYVVFSSDHGLAVGSHGLLGKQNLYEHSMRVPLIIAGPGIEARASSTALVYLHDLFPTICDLAGIEIPAGVEGKSLAPLLHGQQERVRDSLFTGYRDVQRAVCDGRWKLIRYPQINRSQLFDLENDRDELHDLADEPEQAAQLARLMSLLEGWQRELGDRAPLSVDVPKDATFHPPVEPMSRVRVSDDGRGFVLVESEKPFVPWGFNYDHDESGRLIEDYWEQEWLKIEADFGEMRALGANVVRIHLQTAKFLNSPTEPNTASLERLARLLRLAEQTGLYLDLTGLGCYHRADVPAWYDQLGERERWEAQATFWRAIASVCAKSPAVFCYDLMNEPVVPGQGNRREDWLGPPFAGKHFVQFVTLDTAERERVEVARAWTRHLIAAIRECDREHLVTVGLVPWSLDRPGLSSGFIPREIAAEVDFVSVHLYPERGRVDEDLKTLAEFSVGKPVLVEETFPLKAGKEDFARFMEQSRQHAAGWLGFYWGKTLAECRASREIGDKLMQAWLEYFSADARASM